MCTGCYGNYADVMLAASVLFAVPRNPLTLILDACANRSVGVFYQGA